MGELTLAACYFDQPRFKSGFNLASPVPVIFRVKLGRTGKSLRITVPKPITDGFQWKDGDEIELTVTEQEIVLRKAKRDSG